MGLIRNLLIAAAATFLLGSGILTAAPRLRLVKSTIGPLSIAQSANGATQTVEAYNAGDASLNLSLSSSVPWIAASVGAQRACSSQPGTCTPLQLALNTSTLSAGTVTGIVTVSDPNAVDAPQTITVTVQIGGAVPASINVYVAPGGTRDIAFVTNSSITGLPKTNDGGQWLSLALDANGSFLITYPYRIHIAPSPAMNTGTYSGTFTTAGSAFAPDNKTIGVTMQVTTQPIAQTSTSQVNVRLAQGQPPATATVSLANLGLGTLSVTGATATGGSWLTATSNASGAVLTLDPGSLSPGTYTGSVGIASNAVNGPVTVPVSFQVLAKAAPSVGYQSAVNGGTFAAGESVARGDIVSIFGDQLSFSAATSAPAPPLVTSLGGAQVLVNGTPAPLYYSSYGQVNFQMPYEIPDGITLVQVQRDGLASNTISVNVVDRAPRLLLFAASFGAIQIYPDLAIPMPAGAFPGVNTRPAIVGDTLIMYAIGLGPTNPSVVTGQPAPAALITSTATVNFGGGIGGTPVTPAYAGLTPSYAGLYQVNVVVPASTPKGVVNLTLTLSDSVSNSVQIFVQ